MFSNKIFKQKTSGMVFRSSLFLLIAGVLFSNQPAFSQISVSPSRLFFEGKAGETVSQTVTISNGGDKDYEFKVILKDWKRDSSGFKIFEEPGKYPHSNSNQVKLNENMVVIKPGENKKVSVYMQIPQSGMDTIATNSMLFFKQVIKEEPQIDGSGIGIKVGYEYGIQLFYTPYGTKSGDLEFMAVDYIGNHSKLKKIGGDIRVKYKNSGNIHKTCVLKLELTNKKTGEEIKLKPVDLGITPLDMQVIHVQLPADLMEGDYLVVAMLSSDSQNFRSTLKVAKKNIYVK